MKIIKYSEIYGLRKEKYDFLKSHSQANTDWQEIKPSEPFYFLVPKNDKGWGIYQNFWKITDIFLVNSVGIVTARDKLTIGWTKEEVWNTVNTFANSDPEIARSAYKLGNDTQDWKVKLAQKDLKDSGLNKSNIVPIVYRPFDIRYTYYTGKANGFHCRPRPEVMNNFVIKNNLAIIFNRTIKTENINHVLAVNTINDLHILETANASAYTFPLYLIKDTSKNTMFDIEQEKLPLEGTQNTLRDISNRTVNFSDFFRKFIKQNLPFATDPEKILYYIYAVCYSNVYRDKYTEFLRTDFPKIPFTKDENVFNQLVELGKKLAGLHLLKSPLLDEPRVRLVGQGDNKVTKREYKENQVWINETQYFYPVEKEVFDYFIGGYQVADKWLKDRQNRSNPVLSSDEIKTYCQVVTALSETIKIQKEIDKLYLEVEISL